MKIYISGPMTGIEDFNYPAFYVAAHHLTKLGHEVYNPADWTKKVTGGKPRIFNLREAFEDYCHYICTEADAIYLLEGWENSHGASAEYKLAYTLDLLIIKAINQKPPLPYWESQCQ